MAADVAVLMAAYNADRTLRQAVDSVLASTAPFRLFLIDDCSRVPVSEFLGTIDPRIELVRLDKNRGLAAALNIGLDIILARGYRLIARMDADDVCYPERLARQVAFLDEHPDIAIVGSCARFIDDISSAHLMYYRPPLDHEAIRNRLFFNNPFVHPTWMMRAEVVEKLGPYSLDYPAAEDYEFMRRVCPHVRLANMPDYMLDYRITRTGISVSKRRRQLLDRLRLQFAFFEPLEWRAFAGVLTTLALFTVPMKWVSAMKVEWRGAPPPVAPAAVNGTEPPRA